VIESRHLPKRSTVEAAAAAGNLKAARITGSAIITREERKRLRQEKERDRGREREREREREIAVRRDKGVEGDELRGSYEIIADFAI